MAFFPIPTSPRVATFRRNSRPIVAFASFLLLFWVFLHRYLPGRIVEDATSLRFKSPLSYFPPAPKDPEALDFWRSFTDALAKGRPSFSEVKKKDPKKSPWIVFDRVKQLAQRPDNLEISAEELEELKSLRSDAVADMQKLAEKLPFVKGTRGIVTTANNDALVILTTSLWVLREAGSTLPVEIWFYDYDSYEEEPCEYIFPPLGAKCMFMVDYLPADLENPLHIVKFTYKTLAIAFSTFEQALFLDCDAFPVMNPDSIFETEPFVSTGFVLWPDYWASTASKYYYEILESEIPDLKEMATTESGQLLFSKATHSAALLMTVWYNTWGPKYWHRLHSQSAPGEGDKDTYLTAIKDFELPWYQVYERPQRVGYACNGEKRPIGSAQSHPLDDFKFVSNGVIRGEEGWDLGESFHPRILFVHGNLPKYDPHIMLDWNMPKLNWEDMLRCDKGEGEAHRMWGPRELAVVKFGWDVERAVWDAMRWESCEHEKGYRVWTVPTIYRPEENLRHDLCEKISELWDELFPGEEFKPEVPKIGVRPERPWGGWELAPT